MASMSTRKPFQNSTWDTATTRVRPSTIEKMASGLDAVVLAVAGLERIGEDKRISQVFSIDQMVDGYLILMLFAPRARSLEALAQRMGWDPATLRDAVDTCNASAAGKRPDAFDSFATLLARDDLDAVAVALPCDLREGVYSSAIRAGKHLYAEKPLGLSLAECEGLIEAAASARQPSSEREVVPVTPGPPPYPRPAARLLPERHITDRHTPIERFTHVVNR